MWQRQQQQTKYLSRYESDNKQTSCEAKTNKNLKEEKKELQNETMGKCSYDVILCIWKWK